MSKLKVIWRILKTNDWILIRYQPYTSSAYPFELFLPKGYVAHYHRESVTITRPLHSKPEAAKELE